MFTIQLGSIESPSRYISIDEEQFILLKVDMINQVLPEELLIILESDLYSTTTYSHEDIRKMYLALSTCDLITGFDNEITSLLLELKDLLKQANDTGSLVYGVGD